MDNKNQDLKQEEIKKDSSEISEEKISSTEDSQSVNKEEVKNNQDDSLSLEDKLKKLEQERDNYREGMLSAKQKLREIKDSGEEKKSFSSPLDILPETEKIEDITEERINKVLFKQNEKFALREVIDSRSTNYIEELANDNKYKEIINYLPRNYDKSSKESIIKALKIAVNSWKYDNNIQDKQEKSNISDITSIQSNNIGVNNNIPKLPKGYRHVLKRNIPVSEWYK